MKIKTYIKRHPKSILSKELFKENPDKQIIVGKGKISTNIKSNLGKAIIKAGKKYDDYKVGGRAGIFSSEGHHWAVMLK